MIVHASFLCLYCGHLRLGWDVRTDVYSHCCFLLHVWNRLLQRLKKKQSVLKKDFCALRNIPDFQLGCGNLSCIHCVEKHCASECVELCFHSTKRKEGAYLPGTFQEPGHNSSETSQLRAEQTRWDQLYWEKEQNKCQRLIKLAADSADALSDTEILSDPSSGASVVLCQSKIQVQVFISRWNDRNGWSHDRCRRCREAKREENDGILVIQLGSLLWYVKLISVCGSVIMSGLLLQQEKLGKWDENWKNRLH